jgi:hypothetical protein
MNEDLFLRMQQGLHGTTHYPKSPSPPEKPQNDIFELAGA